MADFQPFPITTLKTGLFNYVQPWIRPEDAFEPLENAEVYRGVLNKRNGYILLAQVADTNPIMGIMRYQNESTGMENLVVASTRNAYLFDDATSTFNLITSIANSVFWMGTATGTITMPTFFPHLVPTTVNITDGTTTITDNGAGTFNSGGIFAAAGTINYTTGVVTLNLLDQPQV